MFNSKLSSLFLSACVLILLCQPAAAELKPQKNLAVGRVTFEDGKPITGEIDDVLITIYGISEGGEKVRYSPVVKNGAYKQKLVPGQYAFNVGKIKVKFGETLFIFDLVPVGKNWNKNQDADDGIVQDFIWKPTGLRDTHGAKPDPNNATHWHGQSVGLRFQLWREDISKAPPQLPEGTKLLFTLTPTSRGIDGRELKTITLERTWRSHDVVTNDDLNDLPPANYELTGVATLPDGSSKPILLQGRGNYPKFVTTALIPLELDNSIGGIWKQTVGWVTE